MTNELSSPPGYIIAISYALSAILFSLVNPPKGKPQFRLAVWSVALIADVAIFIITDTGNDLLYWPLLMLAFLFSLGILLLSCDIPLENAIYFMLYSILLGEFMASLYWQLSLYFQYHGVPLAGQWPHFLCYCVTAVIVFIPVYYYEKKYIEYNAKLWISGKTLFSTILTTAGVFLFSNVSNVFRDTPFSGQNAFQINLIRMLVDAGGLVLLEAARLIREEISMRTEAEMLSKLIETQYANFKVAEKSVELIHQKYHDLKHQIAYLRDEATSEEKRAYLDNMESDIRAFEAGSNTGNHVMDTILTAKTLQCQSQGIKLTCNSDGSLLNFMSPMDLSALLGNLLDNAIEHVDKLTDRDERWIQLSLRRKNDFVILEVGNNCEGEVEFRNGLPLTTKDDKRYHGYGTRSIRETVSRYGGTVTFSYKEGWFLVKAVFVRSA